MTATGTKKLNAILVELQCKADEGMSEFVDDDVAWRFRCQTLDWRHCFGRDNR